MILEVKDLVVDSRARDWCKLPYPNHPKGCPNYGVKQSCPPQAPLVEDFVDVFKPMWVIVVRFDLASHVNRMLLLHPGWSTRQAACVLYWQGAVRSCLEQECRVWVSANGGIYTLCPEAMGVDVIKTVKRLGVPIKSRPVGEVYKVGLIGVGKGGRW